MHQLVVPSQLLLQENHDRRRRAVRGKSGLPIAVLLEAIIGDGRISLTEEDVRSHPMHQHLAGCLLTISKE